jgi:hypothetical protein
MLVGLAVPKFHMIAMLAVALLVWAERIELPRQARWQIRIPRKLCSFLAGPAYRPSRLA